MMKTDSVLLWYYTTKSTCHAFLPLPHPPPPPHTAITLSAKAKKKQRREKRKHHEIGWKGAHASTGCIAFCYYSHIDGSGMYSTHQRTTPQDKLSLPHTSCQYWLEFWCSHGHRPFARVDPKYRTKFIGCKTRSPIYYHYLLLLPPTLFAATEPLCRCTVCTHTTNTHTNSHSFQR